MSISITASAAKRISEQLAKRGQGVGFRLAVKHSGCSGYSYVLDYADASSADDAVFTAHGVQVFVPKTDLELLDGVELDYVQQGLNSSFRFNNPKATALCGCGESFAIAPDLPSNSPP